MCHILCSLSYHPYLFHWYPTQTHSAFLSLLSSSSLSHRPSFYKTEALTKPPFWMFKFRNASISPAAQKRHRSMAGEGSFLNSSAGKLAGFVKNQFGKPQFESMRGPVVMPRFALPVNTHPWLTLFKELWKKRPNKDQINTVEAPVEGKEGLLRCGGGNLGRAKHMGEK